MSILAQITQHRVITLVPVSVVDVVVKVDDILALAAAVGVLTQRTTTAQVA